MCVFLISPVPIAEPLTSELIDTPVFYNLAPRPIKYRVSVPIPRWSIYSRLWIADKNVVNNVQFQYILINFNAWISKDLNGQSKCVSSGTSAERCRADTEGNSSLLSLPLNIFSDLLVSSLSGASALPGGRRSFSLRDL